MRLGPGHTHFLYIYLFNILFSPVKPALVNVTVDDSGQDPVTNRTITYGPGWHPGQNCSNCSITTFGSFDPGKTYQRSWYEASYLQIGLPQFATFTFYAGDIKMMGSPSLGSAIYVFGILARNDGPWLARNLDLQFYIDGRLMTTFKLNLDFLNKKKTTFKQPLPAQHTYNVSFFGLNDLTNGEHSLMMVNGEVRGNNTLALFDYLVYSYDPENMTGIGAPALISQKVVPQSMGTIVGGAIGGALALILLFASVFVCIRRRQRV
ncbi:hypothetical protein P691DRAFT_787823 [Macrolepiota fuliginosa MF-IS2]|uniref:Uncharacterized protein n=1 Tax=Macrolepiota fuliginosa MF-IS2 TaxID=1400762 RepID=A0A9P5X2Z2_9AGAR|nr:hypothetical protein P691DRAFT_787823 [Macrolepiota fuliginosa MF-IS2]